MEVAHVPAHAVATVERQDRVDHSLRRRVARGPIEPQIAQAIEPLLLVALGIAAELTLALAEYLGRLGLGQLPPFPSIVNTLELLHSPVLVKLGPAHPNHPAVAQRGDYGLPDISLAPDTGQLACS